MGFVIDLIILLLVAVGFAFINGIAIGGVLYLLHKYMGESEEPEAFDFVFDDQTKTMRFLVTTFIHGAIPSIAVVLAGFLLHKVSYYFNTPGGGWTLAIILLIIQLAATFVAAKPLQKVEPKRALILMAGTFLTFIIYYPLAVSDLLR